MLPSGCTVVKSGCTVKPSRLGEAVRVLDVAMQRLGVAVRVLGEAMLSLGKAVRVLDEAVQVLDEAVQVLDEAMQVLDEAMQPLDVAAQGHQSAFAVFYLILRILSIKLEPGSFQRCKNSRRKAEKKVENEIPTVYSFNIWGCFRANLRLRRGYGRVGLDRLAVLCNRLCLRAERR